MVSTMLPLSISDFLSRTFTDLTDQTYRIENWQLLDWPIWQLLFHSVMGLFFLGLGSFLVFAMLFDAERLAFREVLRTVEGWVEFLIFASFIVLFFWVAAFFIVPMFKAL